jgi:hypothetical protein
MGVDDKLHVISIKHDLGRVRRTGEPLIRPRIAGTSIPTNHPFIFFVSFCSTSATDSSGLFHIGTTQSDEYGFRSKGTRSIFTHQPRHLVRFTLFLRTHIVVNLGSPVHI